MARSTSWIVSIVTALLILPAAAGAGEQTAMLGAAVGTTGIKGPSYIELGDDLRPVTIGVDAMWFHSSWFLIAGDFSKALSSEKKIATSDGDEYAWEASAWYADLLAGARYKTESGSFLYLAAGLTLAGGDYKMTWDSADSDPRVVDADISQTVGFVTGVGLSVQAGNSIAVYLRLRHRIAIADSDMTVTGDPDSAQVEFDLGGLETAVGVGFTL
jgi:opacity protein-like surface antigen